MTVKNMNNCARVKVLSLKNLHRSEAHGSFWDKHIMYNIYIYIYIHTCIYILYIHVYTYLDKGWSLGQFPPKSRINPTTRKSTLWMDSLIYELLETFTILFASPKNLSPGCPCGSCGPSSNVVPHTSASSESYGSWSSLFLLRSCVVLNSSWSLRSFHMNFCRSFCLLKTAISSILATLLSF